MKETDLDGSSEPYGLSGNEGQIMKGNPEAEIIMTQENRAVQHNIAPDDSNQSDEDEPSVVRVKRRIQAFLDSDEDSITGTVGRDETENGLPSEYVLQSSPSKTTLQTDNNSPKKFSNKSQFRKIPTCDEEPNSDSKNDTSSDDELQPRIKSKRNKLRDKFKRMHAKKNVKLKVGHETEQEKNCRDMESSDSLNSSIKNIKQIINEKPFTLISTLYDPDTSDEETSTTSKGLPAQNARKSTKPTLPKPLMLSAKQAMENMQKIKSESNRMLREKDVSLPYHRPKALTLKDIMSRRRAAVTADGKAMPIKMNDEQLKQYVQILEQRQKEVIELCKSDTEDEDEIEISKEKKEKTESITDELLEVASQNDTLYDDLSKTDELRNSKSDLIQLNTKHVLSDGCTNENINNTAKLLNNDTNAKIENNDAQNSKTNYSESIVKNSILQEVQSSKENENKLIDESNSMEIELVFNNSVEEDNSIVNIENNENIIETANNTETADKTNKSSTDIDSQLISLHYDTENNTEQSNETIKPEDSKKLDVEHNNNDREMSTEEIKSNEFSDDDMNIDDIEALIENAEIAASQSHIDFGVANSPMLIKERISLSAKPKLTGAPGMVIDLDGTDPVLPKKLSGIELLKERFVFFSKLKTKEELEREREKRIKPGMQHLKLKQELEEQIAEQRSLEWAKRLDDEKQHQKELKALRGEGSDAEDDIDAIEAKLNENEDVSNKEISSESEEEEEELEQEIEDKPRKRNPMVDDEAEESDCDEGGERNDDSKKVVEESDGDEENADADAENESDESEEESSDESEDEQQQKPKKSRILKAFEDSDDEYAPNEVEKDTEKLTNITGKSDQSDENANTAQNQLIKNTQDDELNLAQKSLSEDLFTSQESSITHNSKNYMGNVMDKSFDEKEIETQTFSILETTGKKYIDSDFTIPDTLANPHEAQSYGNSLDAVVAVCSGSFSQTQNLVSASQSTSDVPVSQVIGDDVLALCTGQFYDNQFVSQLESENKETSGETITENIDSEKSKSNNEIDCNNDGKMDSKGINKTNNQDGIKYQNGGINIEQRDIKKTEDPNLKSILEELSDPEFDSPKPNKFFVGNDNQDKETKQSIVSAQFKKKFTIDSDEEATDDNIDVKKKKKNKKKKLGQRALQISDDEDEHEEEVECESETEDDVNEQMVEYDSDENEVVVQAADPKKKRKLGEFFEQEAELTSEDEWAGSGDEDEAGLDRLEREEGDDDTFNERQLQRELGQIHMRDVMDQDKREVRLIQELLFEDADLGGGSRQRKFRWKNADGEEVDGTGYGEFADTQEEEFESEEQWRKQRHEREVFLRSLKNQEEPDESLNISMNRTTIIKANLSKNSGNLFMDGNTSIEEAEIPGPEKKTASARDIPSPKKPFTIFQQSYHGSLLSRGRGALARLAALATPLAAGDAAPAGSLQPAGKRNFVFAAIDHQDHSEAKVTKRKAENNVGTPKLVKKMRTEDKHKQPKSSLLDHIKV